MASGRRFIPDLYFPDEDQELQTSSVEGEGGRGQGGGLEGGKTVDLTPEGFIPIHKLTLKDLPEPIRTREVLKYILDVSTQVVRVNNNGLSDLRPDDDEFKRAKQKGLTGSGVLWHSRSETLITNRHVLFNEEELRQSTFDVFYDYNHGDKDDEKKRCKRCGRTNGNLFWGKFSKDDIVVASYTVKDEMTAHIKAHCLVEEIAKDQRELLLHFARIRNKPLLACLISHPLGQPKHVSFGEMVHYDMPSKTVYHTAPSKPGSSGGRVIVFSQPLLHIPIVHVGRTDLPDGKNYKYARIYTLGFSILDFLESQNVLSEKGDKSCGKQEITLEEFCGSASASVEIASLAAFVPIFGAFLLHLVETRLEGLDANVLMPCKAFLTDEPLIFYQLKQSVKKVIQKVAQVFSGISPFPSSSLDDTSDLVSLLKSQGPCYCQSIVKMMERGVKLVDGTVTECFLSPYTAAAKMSSDGEVTWPWLKGRNSDLDKCNATEGCLLKKCLKLADSGFVPVLLLLLIARANVDVKHLHLQSSDSSSTMMERDNENKGKTVHEQSKQEPRLEENTEKRHSETRHSPPLAKARKVSSSAAEVERDWHRLFFDVLKVMVSMESMFSELRMRLRNKSQNVTSEHEVNEDISKLYSRCLAVAEHSWQHEWQAHPDTVHSGQDDSKVNWCKCGRPGTQDVFQAYSALSSIIFNQSKVDWQIKDIKVSEFKIFANELDEKTLKVHIFSLIEKLQQFASDESLPQATVVLTFLDRQGSFPRGRHSLMLCLTSKEAFLYNVCVLARRISKRLQPRHFAFPVSVFGRPGNWPGNVTPPEVQRTAWRLIQDAIRASGFRPALLAALEKDADRREKLIDLYVDMKQLKWQGRIQPHLFGERMAASRKHMMDHLHTPVPFEDPTHYFVWYATYLVCPKILTSQSPKSRQCPLM